MRVETALWGVAGSATTMLARAVTRRMMHDDAGTPRLPRTARRGASFGTFLALAGATGVIFALADVLREQRKRTAEVAA